MFWQEVWWREYYIVIVKYYVDHSENVFTIKNKNEHAERLFVQPY